MQYLTRQIEALGTDDPDLATYQQALDYTTENPDRIITPATTTGNPTHGYLVLDLLLNEYGMIDNVTYQLPYLRHTRLIHDFDPRPKKSKGGPSSGRSNAQTVVSTRNLPRDYPLVLIHDYDISEDSGKITDRKGQTFPHIEAKTPDHLTPLDEWLKVREEEPPTDTEKESIPS